MDPEVLADIKLREETRRDSTRTRGAAVYSWRPPETVAVWPCKACKCLVEVAQDPVDWFNLFNRELAKRGEEPLDKAKIAYCDRCRIEFRRTGADRRRAEVERMRPAIIAIKASKQPRSEHEHIANLRKWHHPDVDGLLQWCDEQLKTPSGKKRGGGL
jgi:hypothetical protein